MKKKIFLATQKEHLSKRSQNIINYFGGIEQILEYYKNHNSFLLVKNAGTHSDLELRSFCDYLVKEREGKEDEEINIKIHSDLKVNNCISIYELEKIKLSTRVKNIL